VQKTLKNKNSQHLELILAVVKENVSHKKINKRYNQERKDSTQREGI